MRINDQADKLREIINNLKMREENSLSSAGDHTVKRKSRVITVTSGKGGVGKTNISVNLALNLSQMGYRVVILDADFGLANIDILFGISPRYTLLDVIHSNKTMFDILSEGPLNVKFISGGSGIQELIHLDKHQLDTLINKMASLDQIADIIIVDTGAGVSDTVVSFIFAADEVILITTPEPTAIMDAYALIKTVTAHDKHKDIQVIVNRAENQSEAENVANKLCLAAEKFLGVKLRQLGYVLYDTAVVKAVKQQQPFILSYPKALVSKQVNEIARKLIDDGENFSETSSGFKGFFSKLTNFINV